MTLGFHAYVEKLSAWLATLSPAYHQDIRRTLENKTLSGDASESERSQRLYDTLRQVFASHSRTMNVIRLHDAQHGDSDGYSVLKKLAEEFSIKTRTDGYFFKQSINQYRVPRTNGQTSRDIVQAVESELYLFDRLVDTVSDRALQSENWTSTTSRSEEILKMRDFNPTKRNAAHGAGLHISSKHSRFLLNSLSM